MYNQNRHKGQSNDSIGPDKETKGKGNIEGRNWSRESNICVLSYIQQIQDTQVTTMLLSHYNISGLTNLKVNDCRQHAFIAKH